MLTKFFPKEHIFSINAEKLIEGSWQENADLLVMPGGASLPYAEKLNGKGNEIIKNYVSGGGKYLGICAGSYYASSYIEFDKGGPLEVIGTKELDFFSGKTIGPALSYYTYNSNDGATAAKILFTFESMKMKTNKNMKLYHHGGGFFEHADSFPNVNVLANYVMPDKKNLAAIIQINYGHGLALLSGVHFEVDPYMLSTKDPHLQTISHELQENNDVREYTLDYIFRQKMFMMGDEFIEA